MPSRPTLTRLASSEPSSFLVAPKMMILAPGFSSDFSPATKVTIGVSGVTSTFFSPSLYLTTMVSPSLASTFWSTVAMVMVLLGRRSQGREPSPVPRIASGQTWIATAFWLLHSVHADISPLLDVIFCDLGYAGDVDVVGHPHLHVCAVARLHRQHRAV